MLGLAACALVGLDACLGAGRTPIWNTAFRPTPVANRERGQVLHAAAQRAWLGRAEEVHAEEAIGLWRAALEADSSRAEVWAHLAQALYWMAFAHLEERGAADDVVSRTYLDAIATAERGLLVLMPDLGALTERGMLGPLALSAMQPAAVPLLYWRASALGRWSHRDGLNTRVDARSEVRASMERILQLDRDYAHCGADRLLGSSFAVLPTTLGGDLERARAHFLYAIERWPAYLGNRVRYAIDVSVREARRGVFVEQLELALRADPNALPEVGPENQLAQRRAREALDRIAYYFD